MRRNNDNSTGPEIPWTKRERENKKTHTSPEHSKCPLTGGNKLDSMDSMLIQHPIIKRKRGKEKGKSGFD
jgi:hypothetical protein